MNSVETKTPQPRRVVFGVLAAFILLAPALPQVFGVYSPMFRGWVMYSTVGLGLLRGDIVVTRADGIETLTPDALLGIQHYPWMMSLKDRHLVLDEATLSAHMSAYCTKNAAAISLSFQGQMSWLDGWRPLSATVECV